MSTPRANLRTVKIVFDAAESEENAATAEPVDPVDGGAESPPPSSTKGATSLFSGTFLVALGGFDGKNFLKSMEVLAGAATGTSGTPEWQTYVNFNKPSPS